MNGKYESKIVTTDDELIKYTNLGYECITIGENKW
jgi:hypothetical protein